MADPAWLDPAVYPASLSIGGVSLLPEGAHPTTSYSLPVICVGRRYRGAGPDRIIMAVAGDIVHFDVPGVFAEQPFTCSVGEFVGWARPPA